MAEHNHPHNNDEPEGTSPGQTQQEEAPEQQTPEQAKDVGGKALADALKVSFNFLKIAMIVLILVYLVSGVFYVEPDEVKIKVRFGKPVRVDGKYVIDSASGWHIRWPWESLESIPVSEQTLDLDEEFWYYRSPLAKEDYAAKRLPVRDHGYLITGDVNIVHMKVKVRYRARTDEQGALYYAFRLKNPKELLRRVATESAIKIVGEMDVMTVLSEGRRWISQQMERTIHQSLEEFTEKNGFSPGIEVSSVEFITAPEVTKVVNEAFDEAQQAKSEANQIERDAQAQETRILSEAEAERARILAKARAYKRKLVEIARADAGALKKLIKVYETSPAMAAILRDRHYHRVAEKLLSLAQDPFILHTPGEDTMQEVRLLLGRPGLKKKEQKQEGIPKGDMPLPE